MASPNLDYQNFYSSTLSSTITAGDSTIYLDTLPTPSEGYLVIEPDSTSNREIIYYTSKGANYVTVPSSGGRGVGGTSAVAHSSGATVNMNNVAEMWTAIKDGSANTGMHQWFDDSFVDYVRSGATIAQATGLIASISSGVVYINGRRLTLDAASKTFTASKDTYVDVVALSGSNTATLSYTEVNSGVSGSAPVSNGIHLGMVQTHTASITRTVQSGTDVLGNPIKTPSTTAAVNIDNPYKFSVYASGNTSITNTTQKVVLNTERFDTNNNFDSSTNYRYTAPVTGFYQLSAQVGLGSAGAGTSEYGYLMIYKNNAELVRSEMIPGVGSANLLPRPHISILVSLTAGDYLELWCTYTGSRNIVGGDNISWFTGFLVSRT